MAEKTKNIQENLEGGITQEQLAAFKKAHTDVFKISVKRADGTKAVCYLKPADRNVTAMAMSKMGANKLLEAGEALLTNCWLAGDEDIKTNDKLYVAAAQQAYSAFDIPESEVEKL